MMGEEIMHKSMWTDPARIAAGIVLLLILMSFDARGQTLAAERVLPQCQTEESRGLRFTSQEMIKAANDADPWQGCGSIIGTSTATSGQVCVMSSSIADAMKLTQRQFQAQATSAILRARALEAAHCPQWADAILHGGPITDKEKTEVKNQYYQSMKKEWNKYQAIVQWQKAHPQCKHVEFIGATGEGTDNLSGNFDRKIGWCSIVDIHGAEWRGTEDDISMYNPVLNDLIGKFVCADSLRKFSLGIGDTYVDPEVCTGQD